MGINVPTFVADKTAGIAKIVTVEGIPFYWRKQFCKDNGDLSPELSQLKRADLVAEKARLTHDITQLDAMIADIDAAV